MSIEKVLHTLVEAVGLVFLVMFLFLQNVRYTIIPTIVVPVALLGTCAVMLAMGFSINVLTMFGMVLAIGILVDDAIIVVENVERIMSEEGLTPKDATRKAMKQITGAVIGITLVLASVFIPMAFFPGAVGVIYRQFSLTMVVSILFSALLALSLTPALCASFLKQVPKGHHHAKRGFFGWFNRGFDRTSHGYTRAVGGIVRRTGRFMVIYLALLAVSAGLSPASFVLSAGRGPGLRHRHDAIAFGSDCKPHHGGDRADRDHLRPRKGGRHDRRDQWLLLLRKRAECGARLRDAQGLERARCRQLRPVDRRSRHHGHEPDQGRDQLRAVASGDPGPRNDGRILLPPPGPCGSRPGGTRRSARPASRPRFPEQGPDRGPLRGHADAAQVSVNIDREKANTFGVTFADINSTISTNLGSSYVNDFPNAGRMQRVTVQADETKRMQTADLLNLNVRNSNGGMVPLSAFADVEWVKAPTQTVGYNGYPAVRISGEAAPGYSSGDAIAEMERLVAELPAGFGYEWTGQSLQEIQSGSQAPLLIALSCLLVFLCLAALYESWSIPVSVIMVVPLGVIGAVLAVTMRDMPNDVYFKVGLIAIIGLSAKNAILIIEFAKELREQGKSLIDSTLEAAHLRFRPILMTSLAFTLGVLPLAIATGASSGSQRAIGTGVMGGMISATVLAIFFVPVFFVFVMKIFERGRAAPEAAKPASETTSPAE